MGFFNKKRESKAKNEKIGSKLNVLKEDDLLNIAGGQNFHSEEEEVQNQSTIKSIIQG